MKSIKIGSVIKLIDSDLSGICVSLNIDGSVNIETSEGLIIPVKVSQILVSDPDTSVTLTNVSGRGKKDKQRSSRKTNSRPIRGKAHDALSKMDIAEVDLHMRIKAESNSGPSSTEILNLQLNKFSIALKKAVFENKKELIVIHGDGSGKLKEEVRKMSKNLFPQFVIMDAPLYKYGSGATLIIIK